MSFSFLPKLMLDSLTQITPQMLQQRGIKLLMLDFDNTIVPYTTDVPTQQMHRWLRTMQDSEITVCIVSNSKKRRVVDFCEKYDLDCIIHSKKPFQKGIQICLQRYQISPQQAALVGDQIYTDVLGANCAGVTSVLIRAIHNHTIWLKLRHVAEQPFIAAARGRRYHEE